MSIPDAESWNARMRRAERLAIQLVMPVILWPRWTSYQIMRFQEVYLPRFWKEGNRKPVWRCTIELLALLAKWRCTPFHYFRHHLYSADVTFKDVLRYIPETVFYYRVLPRWRLDAYQLDDKIVWSAIAAASGLPIPKTLLTIRNGIIATDRGLRVMDQDHVSHLLAETSARRIYLKPAMCGSAGRGILVFQQSGAQFYHGTRKLTFHLLHELAGSDWIAQEEVKQTTQLERIFPGTTNTFKVTTVLHRNTPQVIRCVVRFGRGASQVDNLHSGGLLVNVDTTTGRLSKHALDVDLNEYSAHPDTGIVFAEESFSIEPILGLACRAAIAFPCAPVAGWDIALCSTGPVLLEGNSSPDIGTVQRFGGVATLLDRSE